MMMTTKTQTYVCRPKLSNLLSVEGLPMDQKEVSCIIQNGISIGLSKLEPRIMELTQFIAMELHFNVSQVLNVTIYGVK